jgi:hypothetical protein
LLSAFEKDKLFEEKYATVPGVGGFLINFVAMLQTEVDSSHRKSDELDREPNSPYGRGTTNGASEEQVGTHSLMAKDGKSKEPLREEAIAMAKFASAALAILLVRRIQNEPDSTKGLDWDTLVRHFVRLPPDRAGCWEEEVLAAFVAGAALPTLDTVQDKPNYRMLGANDKKLGERRKGGKRKELEGRYQGLEAKADNFG